MNLSVIKLRAKINRALALCLFCGGSAPAVVMAVPIAVPDAIRPGPVRPALESEPEAIAKDKPDGLEIPAVIDRPFEIDEGEVVAVKKFRLLDAQNLPEYGIKLAEVRALLTQQSALRPEGFTIGQLQLVADAVTDYYRQKGLLIAQAVVPVQTVSGGIVDVQLFIGKLGRVLTEGNEIYADNILKTPFMPLLGKPVTKAEIEAALLRLTDYAGLSVYGVFQPGLQAGTADIVLKVQDEKRFDVAYRLDNHGTDSTGRNRWRTTVDWNNPSGGADEMIFSYQQTYNPKNSVFKSIDYERFLSYGYKIGAFANRNMFDVGGEFATSMVSSQSSNHGFFVEKSFLRSRQKNLLASLSLTRKESITTTAGIDTNRDKLTVLSLSADYDSVDTFGLGIGEVSGGINFLNIELSQGIEKFLGAMGSAEDALNLDPRLRPSRQGGAPNNEYAAGQFTKLFGGYTRLQTLTTHQSLLLRLDFQWSSDLLVPLEQYAVGGPSNVRAFPPGQVLWDRAYFLSFEWLINAPGIADVPAFDNRTWGELVQVHAFYDHALGRVNQPAVTQVASYDSLKGAGVALSFNLPGTIESRITWAWEIGKDTAANDKGLQVWGDLTYYF